MANPLIKAWPGFAAQVIVTPPNSVASPFRVRATSVGLQVKQEINYPDLIDGSIDKSGYSLGPKIVEGDISFPMIHEGTALGLTGPKASCSSFSTSLAEAMWKIAAQRESNGRLANVCDIEIVYPDNARFKYPGCVVNTMGIKVVQGATVDFTCSIVGGTGGIARSTGTGTFDETPNYLSPARLVTWNDFKLAIYSNNGNLGSAAIDGEGIREFNVDLKNNVERYQTLNGSLAPQDITARKREISGNLKILGRSQYLNSIGEGNENRFTSDEHIAFGYSLGAGNIYWATVLHGVIFKMEEMTVNPSDVFETSVAFNASGDCGYSYEATELGKSLGTTTLPTGISADYGGKSRSAGFEASTHFGGW